MFEGYIHNQPEQFPETKIDFYEVKDDWNRPTIRTRASSEGNVFAEDKNKKAKRTSLGNEDESFIIDLEKYEHDISNIDLLSNEEKSELKELFTAKISDYRIYDEYTSKKIFAEEIFKTGFKLGLAEDEVNQYVYNGMIRGITSKNPPENDIDQEFPIVYEKIKNDLVNLEKRGNLIDTLKKNIISQDSRFANWSKSLDYLDVSDEEKDSIINSYLDFSGSDNLEYRLRDVFGYKWELEENFQFSKEQRLTAFSTMNPDQRSRIIAEYKGSMDKIDFLPFKEGDILEFGVNSIEFPRYAYPNDIEQAQKKIQEDFPNSTVSPTDIAKRLTFKNLSSIKDIEESLARNSIEMTTVEIVNQFSSPEDFVLKQIKGASVTNLKALQSYRNNPDVPKLPALSNELYAEIKKRILDRNIDQDLKELTSFIPKEHTLSMFTDPELQETFSNYHKEALREDKQKFIKDLKFLIPKSETLAGSESLVLNEYLLEKDYYSLINYHSTLQHSSPSSQSIKDIENIFKERIAAYGITTEDIPLAPDTLGETMRTISLQKLNEVGPDNLVSDDLLQEWFNLKYASNSKEMLKVFNIVKNYKDFSYFDKEIKSNLSVAGISEKFIGTLQHSAENNPSSIERTVEFIKDLRQVFDNEFIAKNYDYLYQTLSELNQEEYKEKISLLEQTRPVLSSPFVSKISFEDLFNTICSYNKETREQFLDLVNTTTYKLEDNKDLGWAKNTILYVNETEEYGILHRDQTKKEKMVDLFSGDYKNTALSAMTQEWQGFLSNESKVLPPQIQMVSKVIDGAGGAGNMKHIESLGNLVSKVESSLNNKTTTNTTFREIKDIFSSLEGRFSKEKWSQDNISEFYNLSRDILEAAPSLYTSLGPIFENISSPKDMKKFMSDIFPFYQTQLVIQQNISGESTTYNPKDLVDMRNSIKQFADQLNQDNLEKSAVFESEKLRLLEVAKDGFKNRFGLLKVPENFSKENLRSIQNTIRYMGNISERALEHEGLISLYLGLELDNKWADFRGGKQIDFSEYISEKQLQTITPLLEEKQKGYELLSEVSGIGMDKMHKFQDLLQEDTSNNLVGDIQTIDVKLGNVKRNIDELIDPDIYQTQKEKAMLDLFSTEGKNVNAVVAKLYGISTGKNIQLSEEESSIKGRIESIFNVSQWTLDKVKKIQEEIQPIGLVTTMVNKLQEEKVEENIAELQKRLVPDNQIIEIFNKLGEEFYQESGALALSKDLSYLENVVVKGENKITTEEKLLVDEYINSIREKMVDMEKVFDHIKQYFDKIKKSSHVESNPILKDRISDIEKVIYSQDTNSIITSQMTKDLNLIIENMRQCLGCMRKEANNDTNLAFGDYNKFFMLNQSEKEKGSISDEIVFFVPIAMPDGSKEMSFVMDQVYGSKSSDVLVGNVAAVYKKYQALKKEFPTAKLSISVTSAAMKSVGLDSDILEKRLRDMVNKKIEMVTFEELNAFIPKSSLSDNYIEFGTGSARQSGDRTFSGLVIK